MAFIKVTDTLRATILDKLMRTDKDLDILGAPTDIHSTNKYNHKLEVKESLKRVLAGEDDDYDFFLKDVYTMIWGNKGTDREYLESMGDDSPIKQVALLIPNTLMKSLKEYAKNELKELFDQMRASNPEYYAAVNNL